MKEKHAWSCKCWCAFYHCSDFDSINAIKWSTFGKCTLFYNQMMLYAMGAAKTITLHVGFGIVTDF